MMMLTQLTGFGAKPLSAATIAFGASAVDAANDTSYSFASLSIGTAAANRFVVAALTNRSGVPTAVTIGGISATELQAGENVLAGLSLWGALVPTGTTATVTISLSALSANSSCAVWSLYGLRSLTPKIQLNTSNTPTLTLDIEEGGVGLIATSIQSGGTCTFSTGTEAYDRAVETTVNHIAGATFSGLSDGPVSCTVTPSAVTSQRTIFATFI